MNGEERLNRLKPKLEKKLMFLEDKSEETIDSTIKALWFASIGLAISCEEANKLPLPELTCDQTRIFYRLLAQRLNNKPLAHIIGRQNFMGIELIADNRALIPRKETEILGTKALDLSYQLSLQKHSVKVIDMGCGGGNLGLALAYFNPNTTVYASDISEDAISLARENIAFLQLESRVQTRLGNLFEAFESEEFYEQMDLIVCNPPYIASAMVPKMHAEISSYEPNLAFDGGSFGINMVRSLVTEAPKFLTKPGWLIFEVGLGQGPFMLKMCQNSKKYYQVEYVNDKEGNIRAILARKQ